MQATRVRSRMYRTGRSLLRNPSGHQPTCRAFHATRSYGVEDGDTKAMPLSKQIMNDFKRDDAATSKPKSSLLPRRQEARPTAPSELDRSSQGALDLRALATAGTTGARRPLIRHVGADAPSNSRAAGPLAGPPAGRSARGARRGAPGRPAGGNSGRRPGRRGDRAPRNTHNAEGKKGEEKVTEATQVYRAEKEAEKTRPKIYLPHDITMEGLRPYVPKLPLGTEGMAQTLRSRMVNSTDPFSTVDGTRVWDLAERLRQGKYVYFRSDKERAAVLEAAKEQEQMYASRQSEEKGETVEPAAVEMEPLSDKSRQVLEEELVAGKYTSMMGQTKNQTLEGVMHLIRSNGTYHHEDRAKLLAKLGSLLPVSRPAPKETAMKK